MRAAAAARGRAAAAVEELELQPALGRLGGEPLLRDVQRPLARHEAGVLAGVRVAEHDQLAVAVRAQRVAVDGRVVERSPSCRARREVGERLEQRREPQLRAGAAREPQRGEHVGRRARTIEMTITGTARWPYASRASADRVEHAQQLARRALGAAVEPAAALADRLVEQPEPLVLVGVAVARQQRGDGLLHDRGGLAHVEATRRGSRTRRPATAAAAARRGRRGRSRRSRARARGRRAAPAGRRSRARARAGRACCRAGGR